MRMLRFSAMRVTKVAFDSQGALTSYETTVTALQGRKAAFRATVPIELFKVFFAAPIVHEKHFVSRMLRPRRRERENKNESVRSRVRLNLIRYVYIQSKFRSTGRRSILHAMSCGLFTAHDTAVKAV